jgi:hypothetical protein
VHIVALVVGGFAGVSIAVPLRLVLLSLVDGALMSGATVGTMKLFEKRAEAVTVLDSNVPGAGPTVLVPAVKVAF